MTGTYVEVNKHFKLESNHHPQPLDALLLLENGRIADALTKARDSRSRFQLDVCLLWACLQVIHAGSGLSN